MANCQKGDTAVVVRDKHPNVELWIDPSLLGCTVTVVENLGSDELGPIWAISKPFWMTVTLPLILPDGSIWRRGDNVLVMGLPDWCLQPIRRSKTPDEIPAPPRVLEHQQ